MDGPDQKRNSIAIVWLIAGVALGFAADRLLSSRKPDDDAALVARHKNGNPPAAPAADVPAPVGSPVQSDHGSALETLRRMSANRATFDLPLALTSVRAMSADECVEAMKLFRWLGEPERSTYLHAVVRRLARLDPDRALELAWRGTIDADTRRLLTEEAAREWVRRNPEEALARIAGTTPLLKKLLLGSATVFALAETDPARAAAFLETSPYLGADTGLFRMVGASWARQQPQQAFAWELSLPNARLRTEAMSATLIAWAEQNPAAAAAELVRHSEAQSDPRIFSELTRQWSPRDPRAALEWIQSLGAGRNQEAAWRGFSPVIQQLGGEAARDLLNAIPNETQRAETAASMCNRLAMDDPRAALDWAASLPAGPMRDRALRPALEQWVQTEPAAAVQYAASLDAGNTRTELLRRTVDVWAWKDTDAAVGWVRQLPPGNEREAIAAEAVNGLREIDPGKAVQWLELIANADTRGRAVEEIAGALATLDPAAARRWLDGMTNESDQTRGRQALGRQWAVADLDATASWLSTLPAGASRDAAIAGFISTADGYDPGLATAWAMQIGESKQRDERTRYSFSRWIERDPAAARSWLGNASVDGALRVDLQQALDNPSRRAAPR